MESHLIPGDPTLVENIVNYLKAMGIFDEFRYECLADVDTKSSCQNLSQRVDRYAVKFLANETSKPDLIKNEVRNKLRKHVDESEMLAVGADHVVEQVIHPKVQQLFLPKIIEVVHQYLDKEKEKLNKKEEIIDFQKTSAEAITKTKTTVLDPIADILSFTCSKPKPVPSTSAQSAQAKVSETLKGEKKKEEFTHQTKTPDATPKAEKKKEEFMHATKTPDATPKTEKKKEEFMHSTKTPDATPKTEKKKEVFTHQTKTPEATVKTEKKKEVSQPMKTPDILPKVKKEEVSDQTSAADLVLNSEKKDDVINPIKKEIVEFPKEGPSVPTTPQTKILDDGKGSEKVVKLVKVEECDAGLQTPKKAEKEDVKHEKKGVDDLKLQTPEKLFQCEGNIENKSSPSVKSSSSSKSKFESSRQKKNKPLGLGVQKPIVESPKSNVKESSVSSSDKISTKISVKLPNVHSEDCSPSLTKSIPSLVVKSEKGRDSINKCKSRGTPTKSSDKSVSLKVGSLKKEDSSVKSKHSSEKQDKTKTLKISDSKSEFKIQSESSSSSNKGSKQSSQCSSSYDSSQGSDPDRSSSSVSSKEKHFSKHQKKDSSTVKLSSSKKQSDSGTPKKDKGQKDSKYPTEEQRKLFSVEESAIITSRSDSTGSVSSTSDSQASLKESSVIISSEETSDSSSKNSDKKKTASKDKQPCSSGYQILPPPSPPPPPSGISMAASAEISPLDETQSSQESEFESSGEEVSSESDEENSCTSSTNEECLKETELFRDVQNMFLLSSSSSEFEGFNSSPEKAPRPEKFASDDDVSVSSVHTSDLSSFEDEVSDVECSKNEPEKGKSKKRFTIKEAKEILKAKAEQQRLDALKTVPQKALDDKRNPSCPPNSATNVALSEIEISPPPEPKRESRRERKLNPKYASNEYTSIFDSKRTSFITKQSTQNEVKNADAKKTETGLLPAKDTTPSKRKSSVTTPDKNRSNAANPKATSAEKGESLASLPSASSGSVVSELNSVVIAPIKATFNALDESPKALAETDCPNRIALKIKLSASKNDNETNKDPNGRGSKRTIDFKETGSSKRACLRKSLIASSLESIVNENKPFNNESKHSSTVLSNDKEIICKQKVINNGDASNKVEHARKNSHSKPNYVNAKQSED